MHRKTFKYPKRIWRALSQCFIVIYKRLEMHTIRVWYFTFFVTSFQTHARAVEVVRFKNCSHENSEHENLTVTSAIYIGIFFFYFVGRRYGTLELGSRHSFCYSIYEHCLLDRIDNDDS